MNKKLTILILSILSSISTESFSQGVFNGAIANPFAFCSGPKPCNKCQPFRSIYEKICPAGDANKFPDALNSAKDFKSLEEAKTLDQKTQNSDLTNAVNLENKNYKDLGLDKPTPIYRNDLRDKGYENITVYNQNFKILTDSGYELQVLKEKNGKIYQNKKITDTIYEYNDQKFSSKEEVVSYIKKQLEDQDNGNGSRGGIRYKYGNAANNFK